MARAYIKEMLSFGLTAPISSADWEAYEDIQPDGTPIGNLLYSSVKDTSNIKETIITLRNPDATLYDPENGSALRVRLHVGENTTEWFNTTKCNLTTGAIDVKV